jgi:hypothetical protein
MIPVGLLAIWVFIGTSFWVNDLLAAAHGLGLMPGISDWLVWNTLSEPSWSVALGQFGVLSGKSLDWAGSTETFTRTSLLEITWEVSIALLYLGWIAIWWTRHQRHSYSQLLKG